ncbi:Uncharacterised protein [Klebsiella pneumoniae]|nr:Uncharacterised protein [Klebsiella pneumoniae]
MRHEALQFRFAQAGVILDHYRYFVAGRFEVRSHCGGHFIDKSIKTEFLTGRGVLVHFTKATLYLKGRGIMTGLGNGDKGNLHIRIEVAI